MTKKFLIGAKILGVVFILLAVFLVTFPVGYLMAYSPAAKNSASNLIYNAFNRRIQAIEMLKKKNNTYLVTSGKEALFNQKLEAFKEEAQAVKQSYVLRHKIPIHTWLFINVGFVTCMLFLIIGIGLIMHFAWARGLALWSILFSLLFYMVFLFDLYSVLNFSTALNNKYNALEALLVPSLNVQYVSSWDNFKIIFLNSSMYVLFLPLIIFALIVFLYFKRSDVKEQFNNIFKENI